jgi:hypothetical protein
LLRCVEESEPQIPTWLVRMTYWTSKHLGAGQARNAVANYTPCLDRQIYSGILNTKSKEAMFGVLGKSILTRQNDSVGPRLQERLSPQ